MSKLPAENDLTMQDLTSSDSKRLLAYIQAKFCIPFDIGDAMKALDAKIDPTVILAGSGEYICILGVSAFFEASAKVAGLLGKIVDGNIKYWYQYRGILC